MRRLLDRAPIRLVLGIVILVGGAILVQLALRALGLEALAPPVRTAIAQLATVVVTVALYLAFVRIVERRRPSELGGPGAAGELGIGLLGGTGLFALSIGLIAVLGGYRASSLEPDVALLPVLAISIGAGFTEEILVRGVIFRLLEEWLGTWAALAISAALFGLSHIFNPHATVASSIAIALEAGVLLAAAYLFTRRLWLAIGLHIGWNFTQGGIFGVAVSGWDTGHGLVRGELSGPDWLTGGEFGVEASVVSVVVCLAAATVLLRRALRARGAVAPSWRRR